jgi:uncharacterized glyoxalase superfamily protein PhnB
VTFVVQKSSNRLTPVSKEAQMAVKPDMVGMVVNDMGRALAFYRLLGLDIPESEPGSQHVEVNANGYRIAWDDMTMIKGIDPDWVEPVGQRMSLAFLCDSPTEVDEVYHRLVAAGHPGHKAPWDAFWGQRYAQVVDPDGNVVDIFAYLNP